MSTSQPAYPARRGFVVQIHSEADVAQNEVRGRVEHIVSGKVAHFGTVEELGQFIVQVLTAKVP